MDFARFRSNLAARGADLSAWPDTEAEAAIALLRASPAAQDLFAQAVAETPAPEADLGRLADAILRRLEP